MEKRRNRVDNLTEDLGQDKERVRVFIDSLNKWIWPSRLLCQGIINLPGLMVASTLGTVDRSICFAFISSPFLMADWRGPNKS